MKITLALLLALATSAVAELTFKPSGIRVIRETHGEGYQGLTPFNTQKKGTTLAFLLEADKGAIIKVDTRDSNLEAFTDDKGTDLLINKKGFNKDGFSPFERISKDGKAALVEIESGGVPAAGAAKVHAKGSLKVQTASTKKAFKSDAIDLKVGTEFTVGEISYKVKQSGRPDFGDAALGIELETTNKAVQRVATVKFLDSAGKEIETNQAGSSRMGFGNKYTFGRNYNLKTAPTGKVVMVVEIWTDFEELDLPFDLKIGIGG